MLCTIEIVRNVSSTNFIQSVSIFVGSKTNLNLIHNLISKVAKIFMYLTKLLRVDLIHIPKSQVGYQLKILRYQTFMFNHMFYKSESYIYFLTFSATQ